MGREENKSYGQDAEKEGSNKKAFTLIEIPALTFFSNSFFLHPRPIRSSPFFFIGVIGGSLIEKGDLSDNVY
ncbi:MAG: hypothetical protein JXD23_12095 [Spirochaetales bacterium]|nr:hypothetical protein [Spirochaetales bacterium]